MDLVGEAAEVAQQQLADAPQVSQPPPQLATARTGRRAELELAGIDAGGKVARDRGTRGNDRLRRTGGSAVRGSISVG
jgi:hypothetical protein